MHWNGRALLSKSHRQNTGFDPTYTVKPIFLRTMLDVLGNDTARIEKCSLGDGKGYSVTFLTRPMSPLQSNIKILLIVWICQESAGRRNERPGGHGVDEPL